MIYVFFCEDLILLQNIFYAASCVNLALISAKNLQVELHFLKMCLKQMHKIYNILSNSEIIIIFYHVSFISAIDYIFGVTDKD